MPKYTESDLNRLIDAKLNDCKDLPYVCRMLQNEEGKKRIGKRIKEIIFNDNIHSIDAALAQIESQLLFEVE